MQALLQVSINSSVLISPNKHHDCKRSKFAEPINYQTHFRTKISSFHRGSCKTGFFREGLQLSGLGRGKNGISFSLRRRIVVANGFNGLGGGGGGGGGGRINSETARVLGNLAVAILLTYLSMTGQLGWLLDAVVSLWLLAVLVPIVGVGAFLWWAGRDIVQGSCPNCGNEFQVFKSTLNDELQLCPFCSQPFSVVDDEFVRDPVKFSNQTTAFDQEFSKFSPNKNKGKDKSVAVVDVEAEIRDAE